MSISHIGNLVFNSYEKEKKNTCIGVPDNKILRLQDRAANAWREDIEIIPNEK